MSDAYQEEDEVPLLQTNYYWDMESTLQMLNISFKKMLTNESPRIPQPPHIQVPLRMHQQALLYAMSEREKASINGIEFQNTLTYTNYGVLGDVVGSGKSLTVLGYISHMKQSELHSTSQRRLYPNSRSHFFTVYTKHYKNVNGPSLIVVPHTIYRQWQDYCKKQSSLSVFYAKSMKELQPNGISYSYRSLQTENEEEYKKQCKFKSELLAHDIVLVSNTLYNQIQVLASTYGICWNRIFIDEADSIYIPSGHSKLTSPFTWFITATWPNFVFDGCTIRPRMLQHYEQNVNNFTPALGDWLRQEVGLETFAQDRGRSTMLHTRSSRWLQPFQSDHMLRAMVLLLSSKPFLEESLSMPPIIHTTLLCEQPAMHRALQGIVSPLVQTMLHAGNVEGALQELGVLSDTSTNLVEAATKEREKELDRLKKTFAFKETMEYASQHSKDVALALLKIRINSVEEQLKTFKERLMNIQSEDCPICYENPRANSGTLTPCCHRIFCGGCIVKSLSRKCVCPMCRTTIVPSQLIQLVETVEPVKKPASVSKLLSKQAQLLQFLKSEPTAKVLIFSRYENPFLQLEQQCESQGITYHTLRGNKDAIASTIRSFENGEKRVLFLPLESGGAGLNLVSATHVVLLHAMTPEEETQAIGRAYRLGRVEQLQVLRLLHQDEAIAMN